MTFRILRNAALFSVTVAAVVAFAAVRAPGAPDASQASSDAAPDGTVAVHVFSETGELVGPVNMPEVNYTEAEWRLRLTEEQFRILRNDGTEPAFCGTLLDNKLDGVYTCAGCGLPLFASDTKFDSGTGWPSFFSPVAKENIIYKEDRKFGMVRTEIICARCGSHLGHVFNDGPAPTGQRYCVNSESLNFTEYTDIKDIAEVNEAVLAGGCFWCVEAVFEEFDGVLYVESGYTGGDGPAEYSAVVTGATGHAEAIRIVYDPVVITYEQILEVHMATHDPTQLNRQGNDIGTHYRSAVFYANDEQKQAAADYIKELGDSGRYTRDIVTTLEPLGEFTRAEEYHQDYAKRNPNQPYIRGVSAPKVKKVRTLFEDMLKPQPSEASADAADEKSGEEAEG